MRPSSPRTGSRSRSTRTTIAPYDRSRPARSPSAGANSRHSSHRKNAANMRSPSSTRSRKDTAARRRKKKTSRRRHHKVGAGADHSDPYSRTHSEPQYHHQFPAPPATYAFASAPPVPYPVSMSATHHVYHPTTYSPFVGAAHASPPPPAAPMGGVLSPHTHAPGYVPMPMPLHHQIPLGYPNPYLDQGGSLASLNMFDDIQLSRKSKRTKSTMSAHGPSMSKKHYKSMPGPISVRGRSISPSPSRSRRRPQLNRPISSASQVYGSKAGAARPVSARPARKSPSNTFARSNDMIPTRPAMPHAQSVPVSGMIDHSAYNSVSSPTLAQYTPYALPSTSDYAYRSQASYNTLMSPQSQSGRRRRSRGDHYLSSGSDGDSYSDGSHSGGGGGGERNVIDDDEGELSSSSEYEYPPGEEPYTLKYNRRSTMERERRRRREREPRRRHHRREEGAAAADRPRHRRSTEDGRLPLNGANVAGDGNGDVSRRYESGGGGGRGSRESGKQREKRGGGGGRESDRHAAAAAENDQPLLGRPPKPSRLSKKSSPRSSLQRRKSGNGDRMSLSRDSKSASVATASSGNASKQHHHERHSSIESRKSPHKRVLGASSRPMRDTMQLEKRRLESQQSKSTQKHEPSSNSSKTTSKKQTKIPGFGKSHSVGTPKAPPASSPRKTSSPDTLLTSLSSSKLKAAPSYTRRSSAPTPPTEKNRAESDSDDEDDGTDVVDGETAFWEFIEASQITKDGIKNKPPKKKPAASVTHPSTCSGSARDSLSRSKNSDDSTKGSKNRLELEPEGRRQRKSSDKSGSLSSHSRRLSRSVSPPVGTSRSSSPLPRQISAGTGGATTGTASSKRDPSPRSRFFSRKKRAPSPAPRKYNTMTEGKDKGSSSSNSSGGGRSFLRGRGRSRHKKASSLEQLFKIDLSAPKNTGAASSSRSYSAAPRRSPFGGQRTASPMLVSVDSTKLGGMQQSPPSDKSDKSSGNRMLGLLRRLSHNSTTAEEPPAAAADASSPHAESPNSKFNLRVHNDTATPSNPYNNEMSRSSPAPVPRRLSPRTVSHARGVSISAHEPTANSPVLVPRSATPSISASMPHARLLPDPSMRALRAKVVNPNAADPVSGSSPSLAPAHSRHSSSRYGSLNSPLLDLSRPQSSKDSTPSSSRVTLLRNNAPGSRRASRDPSIPVPALRSSISAPFHSSNANTDPQSHGSGPSPLLRAQTPSRQSDSPRKSTAPV